MNVRVFEDLGRLSAAVAERFAGDAARAEREGRSFSVALSGGHTPLALYRILSADLRDAVPWKSVHFFWSDERFVPPRDPRSNVRAAKESMLERVPVPAPNVHAPETSLSDPRESARRYETEIRAHFGAVPGFDWILLGLGEDGHLASLFPASVAIEERRHLVTAVLDAPEPPPRLTMTFPLINQAREVHFLVSGPGKREAVRRALEEPPLDVPARRVRPEAGRVTWWLDRAAGAALSTSPPPRA
jgi:6-phosphogluconolactonase